MITTGRVPDLRGAYLRGAGVSATGWGAVGNLPGARQEDSTARPKIPFETPATEGAHGHRFNMHATSGDTNLTNWDQVSASGKSGGWYAPGGSVEAGSGTHKHTVSVGGDPETRPKSVFVNWILKATDSTITLVP